MKNVIVGGVLLFIVSQVVSTRTLEVLGALPPVMILLVVVVGVVCLMRSRYSGGATVARMSHDGTVDAEVVSVGMHEAGHAGAIKRSGMKLKKMEIRDRGGWCGYTCFDLGKVEQGSREYLMGLMAGAEAEAAWLVKHHGYSWRKARDLVAPGGRSDMAEFYSYGGGPTVDDEVRRQTKRFVEDNWRTIERNGHELAVRRRMNDLI